MSKNTDEIFMSRCIDLAMQGLGNTYSNPLVGSVIVYKGKIIGEGYHKQFGEAHAEVNAINSVKNKELLKESTIYVSLEPCSHVGKTPACSTLIINKKIPKVVIGTVDTFAKVSGKGIKMLKNAGISVKTAVLEKECRELNKRFFTFHEKKRPYIILKWAQTIDGFIDSDGTYDNSSWITNDLSRVLVHKWRTEEQAILVGTNTAEKDNPKLNVREWYGKNPIRITLDQNERLNENLNIFDKTQKTIVFSKKNKKIHENLIFVKIDFKANVLKQILDYLYNIDIQSLIVEGGENILNQFIAQNLWDEALVFIGNKTFISGTKAPVIFQKFNKIFDIDGAKLLIYNNNHLIQNI